jgi:endonuclease-3
MKNPEIRDWDGYFTDIVSRISGERLPSVSQVARDHSRDPFKILVSTMISLRTKDEVTHKASDNLFDAAGTPRQVAELSEEKIARLIYPAGFFTVKAANIRETARRLLRDFGGTVPADRDALLTLPGVGRKTANLVLNLGFGIDAICVDTHVHRISNRIGWVTTRNPDETETALMEILPKKYWIPINEVFVAFGKKVCTPQSPHCSTCPLEDRRCEQKGVGRRR